MLVLYDDDADDADDEGWRKDVCSRFLAVNALLSTCPGAYNPQEHGEFHHTYRGDPPTPQETGVDERLARARSTIN